MLLASAGLIADTTIPAGNVSGTWSVSGSPYLVNGDLTIPNGQSLIIQPGVEVRFSGAYRLLVDGWLNAVGTQDSIRFTTIASDIKWRGIWFANTSAANDSSLIVRCVLTNGNANLNPDANERSGGLLRVMGFSKLRVERSRFSDSTASDGGAIFTKGASFPIRQCLFKNLSASGWGGAIYAADPSPAQSSLLIDGCEFHDCTTGGVGGSIAFYGGTNNRVANSTIYRGHAYQGGAIAWWWSDGIVDGCTIYANYSYERGGGIYGRESTVSITGNTIYGQYYTTDWYNPTGGGIGCSGGSYHIEGNRIYNNSTVYGGGGIGGTNCTLKIYNNLITGNYSAYNGGGISLYDCWGLENRIYNNTLSANSSYDGGGIYVRGYANVTNNIIWGNSPSTSQARVFTNGYYQIWSYNDIQNGLGGFSFDNIGSWNPDTQYQNNLSVNPGFISPTDYNLGAASPCINAGDPDTDCTDFPLDFANNPRVSEGRIDIGAYEYMSPFIPKAPTGIAIQRVSGGVLLQWEPVTQALNGNPVTILGYRIYASSQPDAGFSFLQTSTANSVTLPANTDTRFYWVTAYTGD